MRCAGSRTASGGNAISVSISSPRRTFWRSRRLRVVGVRLALLLLTIGGVLALELVNTAAEALVDLVSPQRRPLAKIAKDTAAGAVLVFAASAAGVGAVLLWQPRALMTLLFETLTSPIRFLSLAVSALIAVWFVFGFPQRDRQKENL